MSEKSVFGFDTSDIDNTEATASAILALVNLLDAKGIMTHEEFVEEYKKELLLVKDK